MSKSFHLNIGLSDNAISAYLSLIGNHPVNGSQLSRQSGIPRTRIYDILRALKQRGFVSEISPGMYIPLPPAELINQLRQQHESDLKALETLVEETRRQVDYEFIWTIKGYFDSIDRSLEEAAIVDGATTWQAFRYILLPLSVPILVVVFILAFIMTIMEYPMASVLLVDTDKLTLAVGAQQYLYEQNYLWGDFAAAAVLSGLPITLIFLYCQKWIVGGLTAGGVKG